MGSLSYGDLGLDCEADTLTVTLGDTVLGSASLASLTLLPNGARFGVIGGVTFALTEQEVAALRGEAVLDEPSADAPAEPAPAPRKTRRKAT